MPLCVYIIGPSVVYAISLAHFALIVVHGLDSTHGLNSTVQCGFGPLLLKMSQLIFKRRKLFSYDLKCGFHGARERFAKDANVEKMAKSNSRILCCKRSPNHRGGSEASSIPRGRRF